MKILSEQVFTLQHVEELKSCIRERARRGLAPLTELELGYFGQTRGTWSQEVLHEVTDFMAEASPAMVVTIPPLYTTRGTVTVVL